MWANTFRNRVLLKAACALVLPVCIGWSAIAHRGNAPSTAASVTPAPEMPSQWQGQPLRPLVLSELEERFARQFPGTLTRMTTGREVLVLRRVDQPTRMLHPAADCYRGLGYAIHHVQLELQSGLLWRCFQAERDGRRLQVCERIVDAHGAGFTDTSAWYWAALMGQSQGPWQAITVARPL